MSARIRRPAIGELVFRFLLRFLPSEFRGDFGDAMTADLELSRQRRAAFWWREIGGLLTAAVREHLDALRQDVTHALRMMRRTPGFTAVAVLMLALGTGANVAMFSVIDAVMLRSPFPDGRRLAIVRIVKDGKATSAVPVERYQQLIAAPGPLAAVAAIGIGEHVLTGAGDPRQVAVECVTASMFDVLGTKPFIGRTFRAADDRAGAGPTVVLSFEFWQRLGGAPAILGTTLTLNQRAVTITGIMPRGFTGPFSRKNVDGWMPANLSIDGAGAVGCHLPGITNVFARVRAPLTIEDAGASFSDIQFLSLEDQTFEGLRMPFRVLIAAVGFVLLIACANVGGLQLERTLARRREMAVRTALGASRGRLVRQALTENVVLAFAGTVAGVTAAQFSLGALVGLLPPNIPHLAEVTINGRVLAVALGMAAVAGIIAGVIPLGQLLHADPARDLGSATRATARSSEWTRRGLIVGEIALSITVLIGAALMIQTFRTLQPTHPGFDPARKLITTVRLQGAPSAVSAPFFDELFRRLRLVPGVRDVAGASQFPMSGNVSITAVSIGETNVNAFGYRVTPEFMSLMKIPLLAGRAFSREDTLGTEPVVIINDVLARRVRPNGPVIGTSILVNNPSSPTQPAAPHRIVGVIANMRSAGSDTRARPEVYRPYAQQAVNTLNVVTETDGASDAAVIAAIKATQRELRPGMVIEPVIRLTEMLDDMVVYQRFGAWLLGIFAAMAVALAAAGLTTTLNWWVSRRTRELGVRIALGASARRLTAYALRQGMALAVTGIAIGCVASAGLTRFMTGWIYGVTPLDARTFAGAAALMLAIAAAAIYVPMRRVTRVDPVLALRAD